MRLVARIHLRPGSKAPLHNDGGRACLINRRPGNLPHSGYVFKVSGLGRLGCGIRYASTRHTAVHAGLYLVMRHTRASYGSQLG